MITLNATLQAAQDGQTHNPIVELISSTYLGAIPFDGQLFNDLTTKEGKSNIIATSTGRIIGTIIRGGNVYLMATDTARTRWTETLLVSAGAVLSACPVELSTGVIGVIFVDIAYNIKSMTVTQDGATQTTPSTLSTLSLPSTLWVGDVHVSRQSDNVYRLVFSFKNALSAYSIQYSQSADYITWTATSAIAITGMNDTYRFGNPSLLEATNSSELFLFFDRVESISDDGSELINVYYQISANMGSTWAAPVALTAYTLYGKTGYHPSAALRLDGKIEAAWTEKNNVLSADADMTGFQSNCTENSLYGTDFHFDSARNKLLIKSIYTGYGNKVLCSVVVLDVATWTIDKCYTEDTIPAYNSIFADSHVWWHRWIDTGQYVCAGTINANTAMIIDTVADTIKTYQFTEDNSPYGLTKNVDTNFTGYASFPLNAGYLDADSGRMYLLFINTYLYTHKMYLGYIDIIETADPITGKYTWHPVFESTLLSSYELMGFNYMTLAPEIDSIILAFHSASSGWLGRLLVVNISSGGITYDFYNPTTPGFHVNGAKYPCYYDGKIYASFDYSSAVAMADKRGLMVIDLASETVTYHTPTYATKDDYGIGIKKPTKDGRIVIGSSSDGVLIYDISSGVWTQYNNTTLPGLTPTGTDSLYSVDYDPATGTIFAGSYGFSSSWTGVIAFSIYGAFLQGLYRTGERTASWDFTAATPLTLGHFDFDNSIAVAEDNTLWSFWTQQTTTEQSVVWDNETGGIELTPYLVSGQALILSWALDSPNKLTFTLSHGHLFDPNNQMSTLSSYLQTGNLITVRIGERIHGVDYFQNQGTFVINDTKISFSRGDYPVIQISCEDITYLWDQGTIVATESYDAADPATVLEDLVRRHALLTSSQINIPTIANSHDIYHQFIDQTLMDCIKTILDHFGYVSHVSMDNQFSPIRVNLSASAGHVYSNFDAMIRYTPDNSFASFTNRVTVTGESRTYLEVLYDEESVTAMSGVIGWWGEHIVKRLYYSEDQERVCRDPRMEIIQSVEDFWLFKYMGGGTEYISATDYYERWVEITVEGPDLTAMVISEIATVLAIGAIAISCTLNCGIYLFSLSVSISILFYTLACFAAYSYNIWARPMGKEKQTIQSQADDTALQQRLNGQIIESTIDDPLCYTVTECRRVADYELSIVQAQRNRIQFEKIAHLQDEVGDMISIIHPYSLVAKKVLITNLTRRFTKPSDSQATDGGVIDSISGWLI